MAFSGGTFSRTFDCTTDRDNGVKILASKFDTELDGMATGLSTCILKDGTQTCTAAIPFAEGLTVPDNKTIVLGTNSDITIQYDESTNDSLEIAANVEGAALGIVLKADQGDDNADQHKVGIADGGTLTMASKISGSFVSYLTHTPNSTVASSTTAVAGNLTVGGDLTLGSGAVISEAELEKLDGITNGTVAADKAVVVDSNKDIASFRNVTLTGELDAGSLDVSGNADIDGTLETDALSINGTAVTATGAELNYSDTGAAVGTVVASKVVTADANKDVASFRNITLTGELDAGSLDVSGDADIDGTLEADAMTLNGTAITATATLDTGISNNNVPKFTSGVADNDFLRVDGTAIEGRSASEVLSDIAAAPAAGSSNIVTTGALNSGSITSGFGAIDNGSSNITTTGVGTFASLDISGNIDVDGTTNLDVVDIDGAVDMASTLQVDGAITSSAGATITTAGNTAQLKLESTDADAQVGPILEMTRNSSSPADSDILARIDFKGDNDAAEETFFGSINAVATDVSDGAEDGQIKHRVMVNGTVTSVLDLDANGASVTGGGTFSSSSSGEFNALTISQANNTSGNESRIRFKRTTDAGSDREVAAIVADRVGGNDTALVFETNTDGSDGAVERVRIGHSGDVYIGKTSEAMATAGSQFRSSGQALDITRDGGSPLNVNRLSSSGELVGFFQDTAQFGQITCFTTGGTDYLQVGSSGSSKAGVVFETNRIYPTVAGSASNGTVDLGTSSVNFKDGYFSGYLYAAGIAGKDDGNTYVNFPGSDIMQFYTGGSERGRFTTSGFAVGKTSLGDVSAAGAEMNTVGYGMFSRSDNIALYANRGDTGTLVWFGRAGANKGDISVSSSAVAYNTSSDRRLKSNIQDAESASDKIDAIQVRQFDWNVDDSHQDYGLIAQELQPIEPMAVTGDADSDEMMGVDYSKLVPMLIKEIQELRGRVAALEAN